MKTRNSIRAEVIALYKNKVIKWLSESVKTQKPIEGIRIFLGAPTKEEDILKNKEEFVAFCEDWHKDIISGKVDFLKKKYPEIGEVEVLSILVLSTSILLQPWTMMISLVLWLCASGCAITRIHMLLSVRSLLEVLILAGLKSTASIF